MRWIPLLAALAVAAQASPAQAASVVDESVRLKTPAAGIAAGPDGGLWITHREDPGAVSRVSPEGKITEFRAGPTGGFTAKRGPAAITAAGDGALWFVEEAGYVGRITTTGVVSEFGPLAGVPTGIAPARDGGVWVVQQNVAPGEGGLARVTADGQVVEGGLGAVAPTHVAAAADGGVWFTAPDALGRAKDGQVATFPTAAAPAGLAHGPDGRLWFAGASGVGTVGADGTLATAGAATQARAIAPGPDGAMWFTMRDAVGRVTPTGAVSTYAVTPGAAGAGIAGGPDGAVWFTREDKRLGRVAAPPLVRSVRVADVGGRGVKLRAVVVANALAAKARARVRDASGRVVADKRVGIGPGVEDTEVKFTLTGLSPDSAHAAVVTASSDAGEAVAPATADFRTNAAGNGFGKGGVAPVTGRSFVLRPDKGAVRVRGKGQREWAPVTAPIAVPLGAVVDARRGEVRLSSELGDGRTQTGVFHGGKFKVRQAPDGTTALVLRGRLDCAPADVATASGRKRRRARRLWGSDSGGRFRTRGRDSIATVRGTEWLTKDTCGGTLTRVTEGAVSVRAIATGRRVLVRAGDAHFVRHR